MSGFLGQTSSEADASEGETWSEVVSGRRGESAYMFPPDNDFSKLKNINFDIVYYIIGIAYFVIGIAFKDEIILDVIDDNCSK